MDESIFLYRKFVIDFVCIFVVVAPIPVLFYIGQPFERGFFCNDESLRHPYKDSTITNDVLYSVGALLPTVLIIITEFIHHRISQDAATRTLFKREIPPWGWECYKILGIFLFGMGCTQLTTDVTKYTIGRLRPHFFSVCDPVINCSDPQYINKYIENFTCRNTDKLRLKEMRLSFPSGHSSFSAYTMVYLCMYLHARMTWKISKLLRHFLQYGCLALALFTALSRISDYKHHWSDVLAGSALGTFVAVVVVLYISDMFARDKVKSLPINGCHPVKYTVNDGAR